MLHRLQQLDDPSVTIDLVRTGIVKGGRLDLECALVLLPMLASLLDSTYEDSSLVAIEAISQLSLIFGPLIKSTRAVAKDMLGVDLSAEARQQRCQAAFEYFAGLIPKLKKLAEMGGLLSRMANELLETLSTQIGLMT